MRNIIAQWEPFQGPFEVYIEIKGKKSPLKISLMSTLLLFFFNFKSTLKKVPFKLESCAWAYLK